MSEMIRTLKDVLHDQIHLSDVPIKVQAESLGISYSYLANSANPDLNDFKFPLRHLISLCRITKRTDALDYIEHALGRVALDIPTPCEKPKDLTQELAVAFKEFGEFAAEASSALADKKITKGEAKRIEKELLDLLRQSMSFLHALQQGQE